MKYFNLIKESLSIMKIDNDSNVYAMLDEATAYHGSPFDFDKFDVKFIGSGQGAIAHGWGLYFALNPSTSSGYQSGYLGRLGSNAVYSYKGHSYPKGTIMFHVLKLVSAHSKDKALEFLNDLSNDKEWIDNNAEKTDYINKIIKTIKSIKDNEIKEKITLRQGQFYTVKIPELSNFLDEKALISEQTPKVQKVVKKLFTEFNIKRNYLKYTGKDVYETLVKEYHDSNSWENKKSASLKLYENGISGIKYNGYSDGDCVVLFNGDDVKIVKKEIKVDKNQMKLPRQQMIVDDPKAILEIDNPTDDEIITALKHHDGLIMDFPKLSDKVFDWVLDNYKESVIIKYCTDLTKEQVMKFYEKSSNNLHVIISYWDKLDEKFFKSIIDSTDKKDGILVSIFNNAVDDSKDIKKAFEILKPVLLKDIKDVSSHDSIESSELDKEILEIAFKDKSIEYVYENFLDLDELFHIIRAHCGSKYINETKNPSIRAYLLYNNESIIKDIKTFTKQDMDTILYAKMFLRDYNVEELSNLIPEDLIRYYAKKYCELPDNELFKTVLIGCFPVDMKKVLMKKKLSFNRFIVETSSIEDLSQIFNDKTIIEMIYTPNYYFIDEIVKVFDKLNEDIQSYVIQKIVKNDDLSYIFKILQILKEPSLNIQKEIVKYAPQYIKYIPNLDIRIQKILVSKNPYNIKYINNPDKNLVKELLSKNPGLEDYIR